jgi:hypothetical protein
MALTLAKNSRACCSHVSKFLLLAVPLFGISLTGCNNTCFFFTSNPPTGTKAGDAKPACTLTTANGAVRVLTHTVSTCNSCSTSNRIAHIFVSLRGIEVHPSAIADDASPDWQELTPGSSQRRLDQQASSTHMKNSLSSGSTYLKVVDTRRRAEAV